MCCAAWKRDRLTFSIGGVWIDVVVFCGRRFAERNPNLNGVVESVFVKWLLEKLWKKDVRRNCRRGFQRRGMLL